MPIQNYSEPQLTIAQFLQRTSGGSARRLSALVVGPRYLLSRSGKEETESITFDSAGQTIDLTYETDAGVFEAVPSSHIVDESFLKLHGTGLMAELAVYTDGFKLFDENDPTVIKINTNNVKGGTLSTSLRGRPVTVGDTVMVTHEGVSNVRKVLALRGVAVAAGFGTNTDKDDEAWADSPGNPKTSTGAFTVIADNGDTLTLATLANYAPWVSGGMLINGELADEFTLTVTNSGAPTVSTVRITSRSGKHDVASVTSTGTTTHVFSLSGTSTGLTSITIDAGASAPLVAGTVYKFKVKAGYTRLSADNVIASGTYTGLEDTTYMIEVLTGGAFGTATVRVTDSAGLNDPVVLTPSATPGTAFNVGSQGLQAAFDDSGTQGAFLRKGDVYFVHAKTEAESTTVFDKVVLDGPAVNGTLLSDTVTNLDEVKFLKSFTGEIAADYASDESAWSFEDNTIVVQSGLSLYVPERDSSYQWVAFADDTGSLSTTWRAAVPAASDKTLATTEEEIEAYAGPNDMDNDLGYAARRTFSGAQGAPIYILSTGGGELADFTTALEKVESTDQVYSLAVVTNDQTVGAGVRDHVDAMSAKNVKNFRRMYMGIDSPGKWLLVDSYNDEPLTATVLPYGGTGNRLVTVDSGIDLPGLGVAAGDLIKLAGDDTEYTVASLLEANAFTGNIHELLLVSGPAVPQTVAINMAVWKADTAANTVEFVKRAARNLNSRRAVVVWQESGTIYVDGAYRSVSNKYLAAEIAGIRSALAPWVSMTRTELTGITSAPAMYSRYKSSMLNSLASEGVMIVTQNIEGGAVFIRHQLTTSVSGGNLYYEDSVGVNLDEVSFAVKDTLEKYIGKWNATEDTVEAIRRDITILLNTRLQKDPVYGIQLVNFLDLEVYIHPTLRDRIIVKARLQLPLPLNYIDVELYGEVSEDVADATITLAAAA